MVSNMSGRKLSSMRKSVSRCVESEERLTYWQRWYREHPRICVHFSREEYEFLKSVADAQKLSYRELIVSTVRSLKELHDKLKEVQMKEEELKRRESLLSARLAAERAELEKQCSKRVSDTLSDIESLLSKAKEIYVKELLNTGKKPEDVCRERFGSSDKYRVCVAAMKLIDSVLHDKDMREILQSGSEIRSEADFWFSRFIKYSPSRKQTSI